MKEVSSFKIIEPMCHEIIWERKGFGFLDYNRQPVYGKLIITINWHTHILN